jgi:hypothetical protein
MTRPERWLDKEELAQRFGLVNKAGQPSTHQIKRKAATGEWPSHLVMGKLRFSPEDVAAIEEKLRHPATAQRVVAAPKPPAEKKPKSTRRTTKAQTANTGLPKFGFAALEERLRSDHRSAS